MNVCVVHTVASLHADEGGPSRTVSATCEALARSGAEVEIITMDREGREEAIMPSSEHARTTFVSPALPGLNAHHFHQQIRERSQTANADLIHDHGVWLPTNLASAVAAGRLGVPHVVTTRGMLEPWALNHHAWKKTVAWYTYQRWILQQASLLHATAEMEAENLRDLGLTAPIAVIPNGVPLPEEWKQQPSDGAKRQALFLSRIHPKKGLLNLVDAWAEVQPNNWRLVIAGPSENNHRVEVEARVHKRGLEDVVSFPGPVTDDDKWALYRESDLFVLPTFSENFGVVVAEALACGIPAITTTGAPWSVLEEQDCGWWVEPTVSSLERALSDAIACSDDERLAMGQRGRTLAEDQFSWAGVAQKMKAAYQCVLDEGPRPDFIQVK